MGKQRNPHEAEAKSGREAKAATNDEISVAKHTRRNMQISAIIVGTISILLFAVFGAVYGHNKPVAIWYLFCPAAFALVIASCFQWHALISQAPPPVDGSAPEKRESAAPGPPASVPTTPGHQAAPTALK